MHLQLSHLRTSSYYFDCVLLRGERTNKHYSGETALVIHLRKQISIHHHHPHLAHVVSTKQKYKVHVGRSILIS